MKSFLLVSQSAFSSHPLQPHLWSKVPFSLWQKWWKSCQVTGTYIQNYKTSTVQLSLSPLHISCVSPQVLYVGCTSFPTSFLLSFLLGAPLVTWSGWMELKSPVFTPSVPHGRVTGGRVWPSHHQSSLATALRVTEDATVKLRWLSTGTTWASASALSLPSASASWLC